MKKLSFLDVMKKMLKLNNFMASNVHASGVNIREQEFIYKYNNNIDCAEISDDDKIILKLNEFEIDGGLRKAQVGESMIYVGNKNNDGKLGYVDIVYRFPIDSKKIIARDAMLKAIVGDDDFNSDKLLSVKNNTVIERNSFYEISLNGYDIVVEQSDGVQVIHVIDGNAIY
ncbi:hypothetical protein D8682_05665 [Buttiauxella sp. 3AFRM03]|uniref:hypothetical protein n=1 Tax=Buttiauxella sp. 3AFRM03 TaxID=2479367 RepID=UPI000EF840B4|nr:hypothetical protein [Buttiauxella sp. 3AFRM03]AYN26530.1 hypothetical protein D8682_05665 [Buttiauxella sp. 3AFRM03]